MIIDLLHINPSLCKDFYLGLLHITKQSFFVGFVGYSPREEATIWWTFSFFVGKEPEHHFRFAVKIQLFGHEWKWIKKKNDSNSHANRTNT